MTRALYVLRHGKSDWGAGYSGDHERPLKKRGIQAAKRMGRFLSSIDQAPDLILSSSAVRARTTAELAHEAGGWSAELRIEAELYGASPSEVVALVRASADSSERVLVVGHQPTCSSLVAHLTGGSNPSFPTAALARIDVHDPWASLRPGAGSLTWLVTPRLLEEL